MNQMLGKGRTLLASAVALLVPLVGAQATPSLLIDVESGQVYRQEQANAVWFPASLTKLMTAYVALRAVHDGDIKMDTPLVVSTRAAHMAPSKMGFRPGTEVTLDNALKMLMVKSANDIAVTIAEGVSGSVEAFAERMNSQARRIGMRESYFVNPNGLPDDRQVTSARDMAMVARALYMDFPEQRGLYGIGALQLGRTIIRTHNGLMGRYPGADGMKTGFTCAAGFNVVASATRGGRHLIAVVLGSPTAAERTAKAAELLETGFAAPSPQGSLDAIPPGSGGAPNMRQDVCLRHGKSVNIATESEEDAAPTSALPFGPQPNTDRAAQTAFFLQPTTGQPGETHFDGRQIAARPRPYFEPIPVYIGRAPGWSGPLAAVAPDAKLDAPEKAPSAAKPRAAGKFSAKGKAPAGKIAAASSAKASKAKSAAAKSAAAKSAAAKSAATHSAKGKEAKGKSAKIRAATASKPAKTKTAASPMTAPKKPPPKISASPAKKSNATASAASPKPAGKTKPAANQ
jgi:D-alanyl-D-alanine carboxypeptidase